MWVLLSWVDSCLKEFVWGDEHWRVKAELLIHSPNMICFVRIGDVFAVPGGENITLPERGDGQVSCIAIGTAGMTLLAM